jgi:hypothetical protein
MASVSPLLFLWLLFVVTKVLATQQYPFGFLDAIPNCPYTCGGEANATGPTMPACCNDHTCPHDIRCNGGGASLIKATDTKELIGKVNIISDNGDVVPVSALVSLHTRRNYITSTLVNSLRLDNAVKKLAGVNVHSIELFGRNVTISTFVHASVGIGIDKTVLNDKILEIIPELKSPDKYVQVPDLTLSLSFLQDAGALAINQAVFTAEL